MDNKQIKIEMPKTPEAEKALRNMVEQKADMRLEQQEKLKEHVAKLKKPTV